MVVARGPTGTQGLTGGVAAEALLRQAAVEQAVVVTGHGHDAGTHADRVTGQGVRVAVAVKALMVLAHDARHAVQLGQWHQRGLTVQRVLAVARQLVAAVGGDGLAQHRVSEADLADVVQQRGQEHILLRPAVELQVGCHALGQQRDAA